MKISKYCMALAVVLLLAAVLFPAGAASSSEIRNQIDQLKEQNQELTAQQQELQAQITENENEILALIQEKNLIDRQITLIYEKITNINAQIAAFNLLIADKQDELDNAQVRLRELSARYKERIRAMEEEGSLSYWSVLFEANSFADLLDRMNMIEEIAASDDRRLKELDKAAREVDAVRQELAGEKEALDETRRELEQANLELEQKRLQSEELLRQLLARGEEYEAALLESELAEEELLAQIAQMEKEFEQAKYQEWLATYVPPTTTEAPTTQPRPTDPKPTESPTDPKPTDPKPTESPTEPTAGGGSGQTVWRNPLPYINVSSPFGDRLHPTLGYVRPHNGVDLSAPSGTPIYATRSGQVTMATWSDSAGNYVSINHGDGFASIYMHMTRYTVSKGQYVSAGQVIGYVGSTGISTGPHLHFGISYYGNYINPMAYIG